MARQKLDIDSEIMAMFQRAPAAGFASPGGQNTQQVPNLIKYLRSLALPATPPPVNQEAAASLPPAPSTAPSSSGQSTAFPDVSGDFQPKRSPRGLTYPGAKPTPSKLYPFLRIK